MLQKIKNLIRISEEIDRINKNIILTNESVNKLQNSVNLLSTQIGSYVKDFEEKSSEYVKIVSENIDKISSIKESFQRELFDFKLLNSQTQNRILKKFDEELQNELSIKVENLNKDSQQYNQLKSDFLGLTLKINNLSEEINKFLVISKAIKEKDFEMTKFARQILEMDKEKLDLMRKIDSLERLVSKIRRKDFVR